MAVYAARYPLMIWSALSSTLLSFNHVLQDVNREAQYCTCKQPFSQSKILKVGFGQLSLFEGYGKRVSRTLLTIK